MTLRTGTPICPLCEATCGLRVELDGPVVHSIRPNHADVFSTGHACAKGLGLGAIEAPTASDTRWSAAAASCGRRAGTRRSR
jgi:hypothetical protein